MSIFDGLLYVPFVLQAFAIAVDEFYFHRERGLPRWEIVGHPLDTLTVLVSYLYILLSPFDRFHLGVFVALATFSSLFITKDEFVHQEVCKPMEAWLHAVLFVLHPLSFVAAGFLWSEGNTFPFLTVQTGFVGIFLLYQLVYWRLHAGGTHGPKRSQ